MGIFKKATKTRPDIPGESMESMARTIKELEQEILILEEQLKLAQVECRELRRQLDEAEQLAGAGSIQQAAEAGNNEPVVSAAEPVVLYYLQPSEDGRFLENSRVDTVTEAVYRLQCQDAQLQEASFSFIDTPDNVFLAVQHEAAWILTACERSNLPGDNTRSIRTDRTGKATLRNGDWEILQKAMVTYL